MLTELQQLLACRRERENRAAALLRQARQRLVRAEAEAAAARSRLDDHHRARRQRQDQLYRRSLRTRLTKNEIDELNIELDLMAEETDAYLQQVKEAGEEVARLQKEVADAAALYRQRRRSGDRWGVLVDDVAETQRRQAERTEEIAIEDDLGDRRAIGVTHP